MACTPQSHVLRAALLGTAASLALQAESANGASGASGANGAFRECGCHCRGGGSASGAIYAFVLDLSARGDQSVRGAAVVVRSWCVLWCVFGGRGVMSTFGD